jgi:hypothetical protein
MTEALEAAIAVVRGVLDAINDPTERYQESREVEVAIDDTLREVRQNVALELKHQHSKTWREAGEAMGGLTAQRAEQISRGV